MQGSGLGLRSSEEKRTRLLALWSPGGFNPLGSVWLTCPGQRLHSQPPLELGLQGPRPALPNLLSTPRSRLFSLAQTERVCGS